MKKIIFIWIGLLSLTFSLHAAIEVYEFDTPEQEQLFKQLGKELRCPKCQNNNIADSNAPLAQDLRTKVYEMLKAGKNQEEIKDYMVARYGNFVTYTPPLTASTLILWVGPALFILLGIITLFYVSRSKANKNTVLNEAEKIRLAELLADNKNDEAVK